MNPAELQITGLNGFRRGKTETVAHSPVTLGTAPSNTVTFDPKWDKTVAERHAILEWREGAWWLINLAPQGTWIAGRKMDGRCRLEPDTTLELGKGGPKLAVRYATQPVEMPAPLSAAPSSQHGSVAVGGPQQNPAQASAQGEAESVAAHLHPQPQPHPPHPATGFGGKNDGRRLAASLIGATIVLLAFGSAGWYLWKQQADSSGVGASGVPAEATPDGELLQLLALAEEQWGGESASSQTGPLVPEDIGKSWAVIVGINNYSNGINPLAMCVNDAKAIAATLKNTGTFAPERVFLMTDESPPDLQPTSINVERVLRLVATQARPEDLVYFSFSGHGDWDEQKQDSYLLTKDANPQNLARTTIYGSTLRDLFSQIRAQKLIAVIDACHSGGIQIEGRRSNRSGGIPDAFYEKFTTSKGQVTVRSSAYDEVSFESPEIGHGLFTYHLLNALRGEADGDADGIVTLSETRQHLARTVPADAMRLFGERQTPSFTSGGLHGEVGDIPLTVIPSQRQRFLGTVAALRRRAAELAAADRISAQDLEIIKSNLNLLASRSRLTPNQREQLKLTLRLLLGKTDPRDFGPAARALQKP